MTGHVYFAADPNGGPIKIGFTTNIENRRVTLQPSHFAPIAILASIPGGLVRERLLHLRFATDRLHGEFFRPSFDLWSFIEEARRTGDIASLPPEPRDKRSEEVSPVEWLKSRGLSEEEICALAGIKPVTLIQHRNGQGSVSLLAAKALYESGWRPQ